MIAHDGHHHHYDGGPTINNHAPHHHDLNKLATYAFDLGDPTDRYHIAAAVQHSAHHNAMVPMADEQHAAHFRQLHDLTAEYDRGWRDDPLLNRSANFHFHLEEQGVGSDGIEGLFGPECAEPCEWYDVDTGKPYEGSR